MNKQRQTAKDLGLMFYKSGPCVRGHDSKRYVSSGTCWQCEQEVFIARKMARNAALSAARVPKVSIGYCDRCGASFEKTNNANRHCSTECRFWSKVDKRGPDECWPWMGAKRREGHGMFREFGERSGGNATNAHRYAYQIGSGVPLSELTRKKWGDLYVCHTCDNPPCCNPRHLYLGTHYTNMRDMNDRGRNVGRLGQKKYGRAIVERVQRMRSRGLSQQKIADTVGVPQTTVSEMVRGKY